MTISTLLGGFTGNSTHAYTHARAAKMSYFLRKEEVLNEQTGYVDDVNGEVWEEEFARVVRSKYSKDRVLFSTYTRLAVDRYCEIAIDGSLSFVFYHVFHLLFFSSPNIVFNKNNIKKIVRKWNSACVRW